ncbi:MAG: arginine--tRNA ligase, partial [Alphaproteobacteria bacterium]
MNLFKSFQREIIAVIEDLAGEGALPSDLDTARVTAEPPREAAHGDVSTNAALALARQAAMNPRELAGLLAERLRAHTSVTSAEVAGPGFVNLRLDESFWRARLAEVLNAGAAYGDSDLGEGIKVNVEYVSANPTGPLHVGHGRGAVVGDVLASLLMKAGFEVTREYYVNDAGAQLEDLARSVYFWYCRDLGEHAQDVPNPPYPGDYLIPVGQKLVKEKGRTLLNVPKEHWMEECANFGRVEMMKLIKADLAALGVRFKENEFIYQRPLHQPTASNEMGKVEATLDWLNKKGLIYTGVLEPPKGKIPEDWEPRPQTLFRATKFGDDVDRPLTRHADWPVKQPSKFKKSDESWTYFASDIAYHLDKFERGFAHMIDVWGADHAGYVKRMQAAVAAITEGKGELDVKICQLVNLLEGGKPVRMSKRAGDFVTLREVVDRVGKDVVRFIMLTRRNDAPLDFDLTKVTEQSRDNPVFYVQYAH